MDDATVQRWQRNMVKRGEAYHAGLSDGQEAAENGREQDSCEQPSAIGEAFTASYRTGVMHGWLRTTRRIDAVRRAAPSVAA